MKKITEQLQGQETNMNAKFDTQTKEINTKIDTGMTKLKTELTFQMNEGIAGLRKELEVN